MHRAKLAEQVKRKLADKQETTEQTVQDVVDLINAATWSPETEQMVREAMDNLRVNIRVKGRGQNWEEEIYGIAKSGDDSPTG